MDSKKARVEKAKELLTGAKEFRESEGKSNEWLGEPVEAEVDEGEQEDARQEARPESAERYTPSSIEQMTPKMREELTVRLVVEGIGGA